MNIQWSDEQVARLKKALADPARLSSTEIAYYVGGGVSRCAVIGKVNRLKLALPNKKTKGRQRIKLGPKPVRRHPLKPPPVPVEPPPVATIADLAIPMAQRRTLMTLGPDDCRYPVGDPGDKGFFFCGAPAPNGPYCPGHAARCYTAPIRRPRPSIPPRSAR